MDKSPKFTSKVVRTVSSPSEHDFDMLRLKCLDQGNRISELEKWKADQTTDKRNRIYLISLLWWISAAVLLLLTGLYLKDLYVQYRDNPTTSKTVVHFNTTFTLPNATLCIPLRLEETNPYGGNPSRFKDLSAKVPDQLARNNFTFSSEIEQFLLSTSKEKFTDPNQSPWPSAVRHVVHNYLSVVMMMENTRGLTRLDANILVESEKEKNEDRWNATAAFMKQLEKWALGYITVRTAFGLQLVKGKNPWLGIKMLNYIGGAGDFMGWNADSSSPATAVDGHDKICYMMPLDRFGHTMVQEFYKFTFSRNNLPNPRRLTFPMPNYELDFNSRSLPPLDRHDNTVRLEFGSSSSVTMTLSGRYVALPLVHGVTRCYEHWHREDCIAECRIDLIHSMCGCSPVMWPSIKHNNSTKLCSVQDYIDCNLAYTGYEDQSCANSCVPHCVRWIFDISHSVNPSKRMEAKASVTIRVSTFDYATHGETWAWTFMDALGAVGGIVGICLGASALGLANIILELLAKFTQNNYYRIFPKYSGQEK